MSPEARVDHRSIRSLSCHHPTRRRRRTSSAALQRDACEEQRALPLQPSIPATPEDKGGELPKSVPSRAGGEDRTRSTRAVCGRAGGRGGVSDGALDWRLPVDIEGRSPQPPTLSKSARVPVDRAPARAAMHTTVRARRKDERALQESGWAWRGERRGAGLAPTRRYRKPEPSAVYAIRAPTRAVRPLSCVCQRRLPVLLRRELVRDLGGVLDAPCSTWSGRRSLDALANRVVQDDDLPADEIAALRPPTVRASLTAAIETA